MSKLSPSLKALISAAHASLGTVPAPPHIISVYQQIADEADSRKVGLEAWLTAAVGA